MQGRKIKDLFSRNRKALYIILGILLVSTLSLTIVYAALSVTLNIQGNAEVVASSWDIHLDNVKVTSGSVSGSAPAITSPTTATFSTALTTPGDFYEFTIDVVNDGSIDAMIDGVSKTPTLTTAQAKYLKYEVEYQNGESINTKQLVSKNSFVRLKVRVEFRKDITASDLPTTSETLNLSFTVNYVQSDESGISVKDDGIELYKIVSGNLETVGSEIAIGDEHFYIISSNTDSVTMLAKMNITIDTIPKQSSSASNIAFSSTGYWYGDTIKSEYNDGDGYPAYVCDSNSMLFNYVENYKVYLESQCPILEARLIKEEELCALGCNKSSFTCSGAPSWVYGTSYWSGTAPGNQAMRIVRSNNKFDFAYYDNASYGIRPVIVIAK